MVSGHAQPNYDVSVASRYAFSRVLTCTRAEPPRQLDNPSFSAPISRLHVVTRTNHAVTPDAVARFKELAARLERETLVLSSPSQMLQSKSFAELASLDQSTVIRNIFSRIDEHPVVWMIVLARLTGESPVPKDDRGKVRAMVAHWKKWGRDRKYLV